MVKITASQKINKATFIKCFNCCQRFGVLGSTVDVSRHVTRATGVQFLAGEIGVVLRRVVLERESYHPATLLFLQWLANC